MSKELKRIRDQFEKLLKEEGLAVIDTPQLFSPPNGKSVKSQAHIRDALLECLAHSSSNELSRIDLLIAEKYSQGTSYRKIAEELRQDNIVDLHFSNVQRRLQRILAYFASKAIVKK